MKQEVSTRTIVAMGTIVTIQTIQTIQSATPTDDAIERACAWFHHVESRCTRFDSQSEVMQLTTQIGVPVSVSPVLYEAVGFALAVAKESGGAFDPTVGHTMELNGFNREYGTGQIVHTDIERSSDISYRDVVLDPERKTITLNRPLILDLGAVAKGLAVDMAAQELRGFQGFAVNAGGDLYLGGRNPEGAPWSIGIRHPRHDDALIETVQVSNRAVCTSGDYERKNSDDGSHHIIDPRTRASAGAAASVTVIAETAMLADALATAAFVLGPEDGIRLLERMGADGVVFSPALDRYETRGLSRDYKPGTSTIL